MKRGAGRASHLHTPRVIRRGEPLHLKTVFRPVDEMLWAELQEAQSLLEGLERYYSKEKAEDSSALLIIEQCFNNLELARECIIQRKHWWQRFLENNVLFWELIHQIDTEVISLLPPHRLEVRAMKVLEDFTRNIEDKTARETWLGADGKQGPLPEAVSAVREFNLRTRQRGLDESSSEQLEHARQILRGGLEAVNNHTDRTFRQLSFNVLMRDLSGILLSVLAIVTYLVFRFPHLNPFTMLARYLGVEDGGPHTGEDALPFVMLGAIGMIVTNMISERPLLVTSGPTRRQIIYHLFMKPAIGAFAAFLFYVTAKSQILFHIVSASPPPATQPSGNAPISIVLGTTAAVQYAYAVLSVACGYSADKILRSTMDRVLAKLFVTAEKDKQTPQITAEKPKEEEQSAAA